MNGRRNRRLGGALGVFLLVVAGGALALAGRDVLARPALLAQVTCLGAAGVADVVAATDGRLTDRWAWYRWRGLGNVLLGLSLPLGFLGDGAGWLLVVTGVGGLSLAAIGADLLVFAGRYTRGERLDRADE
jgi:peptidoglycan/LPS O-acetylase OafA/YrhL